MLWKKKKNQTQTSDEFTNTCVKQLPLEPRKRFQIFYLISPKFDDKVRGSWCTVMGFVLDS